MTSGSVLSESAAGLAPAAQLLARWWSRPTREELADWGELWPAAEALGLGAVEELQVALADAEEEELLEEYERLLVGPGRAPCPPYESLWRDDQPKLEQGRLMSAAAGDVARLYADLGLAVRADAHELPDHLAVEWEALGYALEQGAGAEAERLLRDHLAVWTARFCGAVERETTSLFYAALARLTVTWTAALEA